MKKKFERDVKELELNFEQNRNTTDQRILQLLKKDISILQLTISKEQEKQENITDFVYYNGLLSRLTHIYTMILDLE